MLSVAVDTLPATSFGAGGPRRDLISAMLSKSRYLAGLQCAKRLWVETREPESLPPVDEATQAVFDQGHEVGRLAQRLFPGGVEIEAAGREWPLALADTRSALPRRVPLYEGAFAHRGAGCRVDILAPAPEGTWDLFEVKSTTSVKDVHLEDVAFQSHVVRGAGIALRRSHLMHLDPSYVRGGALEVQRLFAVADVTEAIAALEREVPRRVSELGRVRTLPEAPEIEIGPHCSDPYACPLTGRCWDAVPEESVFTLRRGGELVWELFRQGIRELVDIPESAELNYAQRIQVAAARERRPHVDRSAVGAFLATLSPPLHYLDFESFALAVPPFAGTKPYQQIPFQFSLHVTDGNGRVDRAEAFLADGDRNPRREFLARLRAAIEPRGSIVAFNASFEKRILAESAGNDAERGRWATDVNARMVDLLAPFRSFAYYHPEQLGSASLKAVLPVLGQRGYDDLAIQDGAFAAREFLRSNAPGVAPDERERIRSALLDYCARDTEGMIEVVSSLRRLVGSPLGPESL